MLEMTSYEFLEIANNARDSAMEDLNRALALCSAFLVAAYQAGRELTGLQVRILCIGFVLATGQAVTSMYGAIGGYIYYANQAWGAEFNPMGAANIERTLGLGLGIMAIVFCLVFLYSVRHPKQPAESL